MSLLSYGIEWTASKEFRIGSYKLIYDQSSSYTRSTTDEPRFNGDAAVNNQLSYVPKWKYSGSVSIQKGKVRASFFGNWISERFSTEQNDLRDPEPAYFLVDASLGYSTSMNKTEVAINLQINNVFDKEYEVVRLYPQPLRNLLFTLTIKQKTN